MKKEDKDYIFYTSIDTTEEQDEFLLELFSCSDDDKIVPETTIHNFDELITFFENMEQEPSCEQNS
ncbi:hypothetical protein [Bacillus tuaregi]|uniref:hypothetical protein n=1 Tax=Bacillus tuaregi TaxID=1816695 RepID=UPI0008F8E3E6|nr:hypothetical protein [Bacillus tuaregi]